MRKICMLLVVGAFVWSAGCGGSAPVRTKYGCWAHFSAPPEDHLALYIGNDLVGELPFYISKEDLAAKVQLSFGVTIQLKTNEFFVSPRWEQTGSFEDGPHYLSVDRHPEARLRILQRGQEIPVRIYGVLGGNPEYPRGAGEYRFVVSPYVKRTGNADAKTGR
jgi:hypothetical protein